MATGIVHRLHRSGFAVLILELPHPSAIRRKVSFCEAIYTGSTKVEGVECQKISSSNQAWEVLKEGKVPILVDEGGLAIEEQKPSILIDGILAKKNMGTTRTMADFTIGIGPGFVAGKDVDVVIETMRGHHLGRILWEGSAMENTGIPGDILGFTKERVIRAQRKGWLVPQKEIGELVTKGEEIARIYSSDFLEYFSVKATLSGVLRGMIREGFPTRPGLKIADIDPRVEEEHHCDTISDKARCIGGSVLELVSGFRNGVIERR